MMTVINLSVISVFCAHIKVCIVFSCHVMMCILNHSPLVRYENIHGHMNVVGNLSLYICNSVFSNNFCLKEESVHVLCLLHARPVTCSMASGIVIAIL